MVTITAFDVVKLQKWFVPHGLHSNRNAVTVDPHGFRESGITCALGASRGNGRPFSVHPPGDHASSMGIADRGYCSMTGAAVPDPRWRVLCLTFAMLRCDFSACEPCGRMPRPSHGDQGFPREALIYSHGRAGVFALAGQGVTTGSAWSCGKYDDLEIVVTGLTRWWVNEAQSSAC